MSTAPIVRQAYTYWLTLGFALLLLGIVFALLLPRGLWGVIQSRWNVHLLPVGHRLHASEPVGIGEAG